MSAFLWKLVEAVTTNVFIPGAEGLGLLQRAHVELITPLHFDTDSL